MVKLWLRPVYLLPRPRNIHLFHMFRNQNGLLAFEHIWRSLESIVLTYIYIYKLKFSGAGSSWENIVSKRLFHSIKLRGTEGCGIVSLNIGRFNVSPHNKASHHKNALNLLQLWWLARHIITWHSSGTQGNREGDNVTLNNAAPVIPSLPSCPWSILSEGFEAQTWWKSLWAPAWSTLVN